MIASLRGEVVRAGLDHVVVEVGGMGLLLRTTVGTAAGLRVGQQVLLATSLVVREDSLTLYGFADSEERELFDTVQTVSGVGPRLALAMLAVHPPDALRLALGSGDVVALTKVPGIGKKSAERLVLELRDKVGRPAGTEGSGPAGASARGGGAAWREQVHEALLGLGWTAKQADGALDAVEERLGGSPLVGDALRAALRELGR